jgi:hypothetical protein
LVSNSARGKTEDSCIIFSSIVICRSSSSARCIAAAAAGARVVLSARSGLAFEVFDVG